MHLVFEKCDKKVRKSCKNDTEISNFIKNKYFIIAYDKMTLYQDGYGKNTFKRNTNLDWLPIQVLWTEMTIYKFESTSFITQDSVLPFLNPKNTTVLDLT